MNWQTYLTKGVSAVPTPVREPQVIYHMAVRSFYEEQTKDGSLYFPPTYAQDGFVHATADPKMLLSIGTHFYKDDRNDWICLELDVTKLCSPLKYEPGEFPEHFFISVN
jgi:uncharacterized protein (DUF952 family)